MIAKKGNKIVKVDETTKTRYLNDGFNIMENGKIIEYGKGATVSLADYMKLKEEYDNLKKQLTEKKTEKRDVEKKEKK